jgi:hemolysin activation/secretion protein
MKKLVVGLVVCWQVASALAAAPALKFDVLEFVVEGNTVLPGELVEQVLQPFMGPDKGFKDIESAREALEKAYQDAGFLSVVVSLPNQRVDSGEVRLDVTEARVDKLRITGAQYTLPSKLREQVPSLAPGQTPYFPQVQQELAAMQSADVQVTPLIGAGAEPETIQVDLKVQDKPAVQGSVELSNRQSFNTSAGRLSAAVSYGNLFQRGHRMGLSWQYAPWRPAVPTPCRGPTACR